MIYGSVCSGIEAATVAWHPLGWRPAFFSEIEKFPSAVLAHHYPSVPNLGDMTRFTEWPDAAINVLVGGTPCQSFSVAGLRRGLADPRGNLALTYLALADRYRPEWLIWENVPGVMSIDGGRAFGSILGALAELGYGFAYRVLDAQFVRVDGFGRAVPQRRRRVFVVGNSRDWRRAAAVLFEPESLSGNTAPLRKPGQEVAGSLGAGSKRSGGCLGRREAAANHIIAFGGNCTSGPIEVATARSAHGGAHGRLDFETETFLVAGTLSANGKAAGSATQQDAENGMLIVQDVADTITANWERSKGAIAGNSAGLLNPIIQRLRVRRLMPRECERLQGLPDDYTAIMFRGKSAADGPRYKAIGNSMAVNVMRWLGQRIEMISAFADAPELIEAAE